MTNLCAFAHTHTCHVYIHARTIFTHIYKDVRHIFALFGAPLTCTWQDLGRAGVPQKLEGLIIFAK